MTARNTILFLCVANSARSQTRIRAAFARGEFAGDARG